MELGTVWPSGRHSSSSIHIERPVELFPSVKEIIFQFFCHYGFFVLQYLVDMLVFPSPILFEKLCAKAGAVPNTRAVFRIRDNLVQIRMLIRILGSVPLTVDPSLFVSDFQDVNKKLYFAH